MSKLTKKAKAQQGKVDSLKLYPLADALASSKSAQQPNLMNLSM